MIQCPCMDQDTKAAFAKLAKTVEVGFAAVAEDINFIKDHMATKDDIKELKDQIAGVESKIAGTNRRLDSEAMLRDDLELPKRVSDLEVKTFGSSRHPKHIPV